MSHEIETHNAALLSAFGRVLKAEERGRIAKTELDEATTRLRSEINQADTAEAAAWAEIAALIAETGEPEVTLHGTANDFRIHWAAGRESVKADADAAPDEFCKFERKAKLKEIGDHLRTLRDQNMPFPNWASFQPGEKRLQYKLVKRSAK